MFDNGRNRKENMPIVSVITPCYNQAHFFARSDRDIVHSDELLSAFLELEATVLRSRI
jgi:hypothetical protein